MDRCFLFIALFIVFFNGSGIGFIFFEIRFGDLFGLLFFQFVCLFGALLASIIENPKNDWKSLAFYANICCFFLPFYYAFVANIILPRIF